MLRGGASDFWDKPITTTELNAAVSSAVAATAHRRHRRGLARLLSGESSEVEAETEAW